jgi:murein DD-endopeptidase MepM/ murein hydrolase activator NlpD
MQSKRYWLIGTLIAVVGLVVAAWPWLATLGPIVALKLAFESPPATLRVPVAGVSRRHLIDTWGAPRNGNRRHEGIDIFAPCGRPVTSATRGVVVAIGERPLGGQIVGVLGPGWEWHYYAHLNDFAAIEVGDVVEVGTVLGYVGRTGNARGSPCHLHYGIYTPQSGAKNPYPLLAEQAGMKTRSN